MKYVIEVPEEIERALERRASATGDDVAHLIQVAVAYFVHTDIQPSPAGRRPDLPAEPVEISPPCDLPRSSPRPIEIQKRVRRQPDPIADSA